MPVPLADGGPFTYTDYLTWPEGERWEIIEGVAYDMSPSPSEKHQRILGELFYQVRQALEGRSCRAYMAPFDVRLSEEPGSPASKVTSVVQPDLLVVCQPEKLDRSGCKGAPDLVVEILSPSTSFKDQTAKLILYEKHGVREYWLVNPELERVFVHRLEPGVGFGKIEEFRRGDRLRSSAVAWLEMELDRVFADG